SAAKTSPFHSLSRCPTAEEAASPASFQPSNAATMTESTSTGTPSTSITQRLLPAGAGLPRHRQLSSVPVVRAAPAYGVTGAVPQPPRTPGSMARHSSAGPAPAVRCRGGHGPVVSGRAAVRLWGVREDGAAAASGSHRLPSCAPPV